MTDAEKLSKQILEKSYIDIALKIAQKTIGFDLESTVPIEPFEKMTESGEIESTNKITLPVIEIKDPDDYDDINVFDELR